MISLDCGVSYDDDVIMNDGDPGSAIRWKDIVSVEPRFRCYALLTSSDGRNLQVASLRKIRRNFKMSRLYSVIGTRMLFNGSFIRSPARRQTPVVNSIGPAFLLFLLAVPILFGIAILHDQLLIAIGIGLGWGLPWTPFLREYLKRRKISYELGANWLALDGLFSSTLVPLADVTHMVMRLGRKFQVRLRRTDGTWIFASTRNTGSISWYFEIGERILSLPESALVDDPEEAYRLWEEEGAPVQRNAWIKTVSYLSIAIFLGRLHMYLARP